MQDFEYSWNSLLHAKEGTCMETCWFLVCLLTFSSVAKEQKPNHSTSGCCPAASFQATGMSFKIVFRHCWDCKVLKNLCLGIVHLLSHDFSVLYIKLVSNQHNRDGLAHSNDVLVETWDSLVYDARCNIKHNGKSTLQATSVTKASMPLWIRLFHTMTFDWTTIGVKM